MSKTGLSGSQIADLFSSEFDPTFCSVAPDDLNEYGKDWTKVYKPAPVAVVFPRSTEEVSRLMRLCSQHKLAVVPSGGRTGLAGGAVAMNGEVVLSLKYLNKMGPVDELSQTVTVQAGAVTQAVHEHTAPHGLTWPIDFASKGSSHVGGNIATNAGGVNVIRYGLTRQWVLGLQVVLMNGDVLELNGALEKNNTGFDLRQLFIGSEGTLGVITQATLKLTRLPAQKIVMLFAVENIAAVLSLFAEARKAPFTIHAYEFFTAACLKRVMTHRGVRAPFDTVPGCTVLLEVESATTQGAAATAAVVSEWVESVFEKGLAADGVLAQSTEQAAEFWTLREGIAESLFATGLPHKNDVSLPVARLGEFCAELDAFFSEHYPHFEICNFGHIGDGNLHINVMKPQAMAKDEFLARTHQVDHDMFALVRKYQGSISAEHGIGLLKKEFLGYSRAPAELALLRSVKRALDPQGLLNPGKILDVLSP